MPSIQQYNIAIKCLVGKYAKLLLQFQQGFLTVSPAKTAFLHFLSRDPMGIHDDIIIIPCSYFLINQGHVYLQISLPELSSVSTVSLFNPSQKQNTC